MAKIENKQKAITPSRNDLWPNFLVRISLRLSARYFSNIILIAPHVLVV